MSQTEKAEFYNELKAAGVQFSKHYREYNTEELREAVLKLRAQQPAPPVTEPPAETPPPFDPEAMRAAYDAVVHEEQPPPAPKPTPDAPLPVRPADPNELPGQRLNISEQMQPIRTDEQGRIWYQEEVLKPAYPKPRGRRVLKYMDTGVREETVKDGKYVETFEVAGDLPSRPAEVKITLPSYQVGIYKDPRFPFKVHTYNGNAGFDFFEVQEFYGGAELVPSEIKRVYVENVLCYDIRTTVREIQSEYRRLQLAGKVAR